MMSWWLSFVLTQAPTHCRPDERVVMSCAVKKRLLSVCAGPVEGPVRWLEYRFGPQGRPELAFPGSRDGSLEAFTLETRTLIDGVSTSLSFSNEKVRYEVWTQDGRSAGGGVVVQSKGAQPVTLACSSAPTQAWDELRPAFDDTASRGEVDCARVGAVIADRTLLGSKGQMDGVQQAALAEAVEALCVRGWSSQARRCVATNASPCPSLTLEQQNALKATVLSIVPP
jgi:hypothetical protein